MSKSRTATAKKQPSPSPFSTFSPLVRDLLAALFLYGVTLVLFHSIIFDNAAFATGGDTAAAASYAHAGLAIARAESVDILWMPFFFSGMPTFGNVAFVPRNVNYLQTAVVTVLNYFFMNGTWTWLVVHYFLGALFMFFLMRVLDFSRPVALFAALAFMLSPYGIGLAGEGHGSKLMALTYLPLVFMLTYLLFQRRDFLTFGLLSAAIGTLLLTNHMQIVYYVLMVIGLYLLYQIILDIKEDKLLVAKKTALFTGALLVGFCISSYIYLSVYEYSQFSMRGGGTAGAQGGLAWDYATNWSWHPGELITLFIPSFYGLKADLYWGPIDPWTNSTVYVGVLPVLLSVLAVIYRRNRSTLFFLLLTILVFLVSFGRNFSLFYELLFAVLPFFNKFRAPAMILHLVSFTLAILGAYGLAFLIESRDRHKEFDTGKLTRALWYILGGLGAALLLSFLLKSGLHDTLSGMMFLKEGEQEQLRQQYGRQLPQVIAQLKQMRFDVFWKDMIRFLVIAGVSVGVIIAFLQRKIQGAALSVALLGILIVDLFIIDGKYITPQPSAALEQSFQADGTVIFLKQQDGLFRIFPMGNLFGDNTYAYHGLQSIGGYSPAKLKIYQTMIDSCLYRGPDQAFPLNMNIVNMLNVRYLLAQGKLPEDRFEAVYGDPSKKIAVYRNPRMLPRAYYVGSVAVAANDSEVFRVLNSAAFDPARVAVLSKPLAQPISAADSGTVPQIVDYKSQKVMIQTTVSSPTLLVLSEVYYPAGWKAYVDGTETEILRTNYILRSVVVPAGKHMVEFRFDPPLYRIGWILSNCGWALTVFCVLLGLWQVPAVRSRLRHTPPKGADG